MQTYQLAEKADFSTLFLKVCMPCFFSFFFNFLFPHLSLQFLFGDNAQGGSADVVDEDHDVTVQIKCDVVEGGHYRAKDHQAHRNAHCSWRFHSGISKILLFYFNFWYFSKLRPETRPAEESVIWEGREHVFFVLSFGKTGYFHLGQIASRNIESVLVSLNLHDYPKM